jgi:hypothetical protein
MPNITNCSKSKCTPKIKLFNIEPSILDPKNPITYNNDVVDKINFKKNLEEYQKPLITIDGGSVLYYSKTDHAYKTFPSGYYENVYPDFFLENFNINIEPKYSISIKPLDCSKPMIFGNKILKQNDNAFIKIDRDINDDIIIKKIPLSSDITTYFNNKFFSIGSDSINFDNPAVSIAKDTTCIKSFYYFIPKKYSLGYELNYDGKTINSINIDPNQEIKPDLTISNGKIQYLDIKLDEYKDFDPSVYKNIKVLAFDMDNLLDKHSGCSSTPTCDGSAPYYVLRIMQDNVSKEMILGNLNMEAQESYQLKSISDDGKNIEVIEIVKDYANLLLN